MTVYRLLGVWANAFTLDSLLETVADSVADTVADTAARPDPPPQAIIGSHNLHSIYLYHHDPKTRRFFDQAAHYIFIDGMPFIWWGRALGYPLRREHRLTCVDWVPPFMARAAAEGWRVFCLGNRPGVAETGAQKFRAWNPGLVIETRHGYFKTEGEIQAALDLINAWSPDVLLVGMGMPRQEHWILDYHARLNVRCIITVGAAMDYFAGAIPTPPRWMGRIGLEWLARLWAEPRRLARRYLVEPWFLLPGMAADLRQFRRQRRRQTRG